MVATAPYADIIGAHAGLAGTLKVAPFTVTFDTAALTPEAVSDIGYLPAHALAVGGWLATSDLDTGDEALALNFGWRANAGAQTETWTDLAGVIHDNAGYQVDADGFLASGVLTGDAVTGVVGAAGSNFRPVLLPTPLYFARKTPVTMTVVAAAATQAAGSATLYLAYIIP